MSWLARLGEIDFLTWKNYAAALYFVQGAIDWEEERRRTQGQRRTVDATGNELG